MPPLQHSISIKIFMYLQVLDFVTTIAGFRLGLAEGNPIVRSMTEAGPVFGVAASKILAFVFGVICYALNRHALIRRVNYWYLAVVTWNLVLIGFCSRLDRG